VYQALAEANLHPDWVAGISIGAINCALIAGNPPETRLERLRAFWEQVTTQLLFDPFGLAHYWLRGDMVTFRHRLRAGATLFEGAPGFFQAAVSAAYLSPPGTVEATSWYDTTPLRSTLERLVDFDRINAGEMRFSVGAVNIRSGNFVYFDSTTHKIGPSTSWRAGRCRPAVLRSTWTASSIGWWSRLQHAAAVGVSAIRARTRLRSKSTCGARAESCRAISTT